ncbi:hypothetical protein F5Y16DRAFT_392173 [Xylariaceae sp. FL0255]|nr:hypothetical protein F5Y16DRAFT_392173 [Xylariaceae sp. FL0255]
MADNEYGLRILYKRDYYRRDVVIVQGLCGSKHHHWSNIDWEAGLKDPDVIALPWDRGIKYENDRISLYTYDVFGLNGGILSREGAREEATKLLETLLSIRQRQRLELCDENEIVFVAHDLGGTLVKEAVVLALQKKYESIYESIMNIVFLGCPHQGPEWELQTGCARLLMSHKKTTYSEALELSGPLVRWIQATNFSFAETRLSAVVSMLTVISNHPDPIERVFDRSVTSMFGMAPEMTTELEHSSMLRLIFLEIHSKIRMRWINEIKSHKKIKERFLLQVPPQYPVIESAKQKYEMPMTHATFWEFMKSDGAGIWLLHAPSTSTLSLSGIAASVLLWTDDFSQRCDYPASFEFFDFNTNDHQSSSVEAALAYIFIRLISRFGEDNFTWVMAKWHKIQVSDLFSACIELILGNLGRSREQYKDDTFTIILGGLNDQISHGAWLFNKLEDIVQDCDLKFKIIIISSDPASLMPDARSATALCKLSPDDQLSFIPPLDWRPTIKYYLLMEGQAGSEEETDVQNASTSILVENDQISNTTVLRSILSLIQEQPQLYGYRIALNSLGRSCEDDERLWKMIVNWLKDIELPKEDQLQSFISNLIPTNLETIFTSIVTSFTLCIRSWPVLLSCVLCAFRPITIMELLDLERSEDLQNDPQNEDSNKNSTHGAKEKAVRRLLTVERQEVHLAHPKLRDFLLSHTGQRPPVRCLEDSETSTHECVARACLSYLTSSDNRQLMKYRAGPGNWHYPLQCRSDFLSYAVKYWLEHAKRAKKEIYHSDICTRFLADDEAVLLWTLLYQTMSPFGKDPSTAPANALASLAIFAEHEAEELLFSSIKKHKELRTPGLDLACFAALVTAARLGHSRMTRALLASPLPKEPNVDQLILAVIESDSQDLLFEITHVWKVAKIQKFPFLIARAISLGQSKFTETLLDKMNGPGVPIDNIPNPVIVDLPYDLASRGGYVKIMESLISNGLGAINGPSKYRRRDWHDPLYLAIQFGHYDALGTPNLFRITQSGRWHTQETALYWFCRQLFIYSSILGRRKPIRNVLTYLGNHFQSEDGTAEHDGIDSLGEVDQMNAVLDYIVRKHIYVDGDPDSKPRWEAVSKAMEKWPFGLELIDFLTDPKRKLEGDDDFSNVFFGWAVAAIRTSDVAALKIIFENGAKRSCATGRFIEIGATRCFPEAIGQSSQDFMAYLIEKGADFKSQVDFGWKKGYTPLFWAAYNNYVEALKFLIERKVNVNAPESHDSSPLIAAASLGHTRIVELLVAAGADVNVSSPENWEKWIPLPRYFAPKPTDESRCRSPLWFAMRITVKLLPGPKELKDLILSELLKARCSSKTLQDGLEAAANGRHDQDGRLFAKLLSHCPDASYLPDISNMLHSQVGKSNLGNVRLLLSKKYGLDANQKDDDGNSPLHCISAETSEEIVNLLLQHGADIEAIGKNGFTPLAAAANAPNLLAVQYLVRNDALVNVGHSSMNEGALAWACKKGSLAMVRTLLNSRADPANVNYINPTSMMGTALNAALFRRDETTEKRDIIHCLLGEGAARVSLPSMYWSGALQVACLTSTVEIVRLLIEKFHADVNQQDRTGRTPLHMALYRSKEHVELLLEHGANLDAVDAIGRNALHFAALGGIYDIVKFVVDSRPQFVNQEDAHGWTPLLSALRIGSHWGNEEEDLECDRKKAIVGLLLDFGARRLIRGRGIDRTWTPMVVRSYYATWHDLQRHLTKACLEPRPLDFAQPLSSIDREWNWNWDGNKEGRVNWKELAWCDHCLMQLHGLFYLCAAKDCVAGYCIHCYQSRAKLHISGHDEFEEWGEEIIKRPEDVAGAKESSEEEETDQEGESDDDDDNHEGGSS